MHLSHHISPSKTAKLSIFTNLLPTTPPSPTGRYQFPLKVKSRSPSGVPGGIWPPKERTNSCSDHVRRISRPKQQSWWRIFFPPMGPGMVWCFFLFPFPGSPVPPHLHLHPKKRVRKWLKRSKVPHYLSGRGLFFPPRFEVGLFSNVFLYFC